MTRLHRLFDEQGQSPWLESAVGRGSSQLAMMLKAGIRGVTVTLAFPTSGTAEPRAYNGQVAALAQRGLSAEDIHWDLLVQQVTEAAKVLGALHGAGADGDGSVSVRLPPALADDTAGTIATARSLHQQVSQPNLSVVVPATDAGIPAIRQLTTEGHNVNAALIFSLERYELVTEAYVSGLETRPGDLSGVHGLASFSLSPVDAKVDRQLMVHPGTRERDLCGRTAVAQAKLAYRRFAQCFSGERWDALARRGARRQRLVWTATSTERCAGTFYVDHLIGTGTVVAMAEPTLSAFLGHGAVAATLDQDLDGAAQVLDRLQAAGVDMSHVSRQLKEEAIAAATRSYDAVLGALGAKGAQLSSPSSRFRT